MRRLAALCALGVFGAVACSGSDDAAPATTTSVATMAPADESSTTVATVDVPATAPPTTDPPATDPPVTEPGSNTGNGAKTLGPLGDNDLDIETEDGTVQIGNADVPTSLDEGFPLPDDLTVDLATETETDLGFTGTTSLDLETLIDFYADELPKAGYEVTTLQTVEGVLVVYGFDRDDRTGQIAITQSPGSETRTILVTVGDGVGEEESVPD